MVSMDAMGNAEVDDDGLDNVDAGNADDGDALDNEMLIDNDGAR